MSVRKAGAPGGRARRGSPLAAVTLAAFALSLVVPAGELWAAAKTGGKRHTGSAPAARGAKPAAPTRSAAAADSARGPAGDPAATSGKAAEADSSLTMRGDREGTVFKSLTVEGEDRIHIEFDRPSLDLDLDPHRAPGLDWGSAEDVLDRTAPDLVKPFLAQSARQPSPFVAHPWLGSFASGSVARFRPQVTEVARWRLVVADSRGQTVTAFAGEGKPPREIVWDGRTKSGEPVVPGLTYSYVFEAFDRAGNKRNFVGEAFTVSAFRLQAADGPVLVFSGKDLAPAGQGRSVAESPTARGAGPAPLLLEAAGWMNQSARAAQPVRVTATARTFEQANSLAGAVARDLAPLLLGDPARVQPVAVTEPAAPPEGTVRIAYGK
jgi:hypothetical protein